MVLLNSIYLDHPPLGRHLNVSTNHNNYNKFETHFDLFIIWIKDIWKEKWDHATIVFSGHLERESRALWKFVSYDAIAIYTDQLFIWVTNLTYNLLKIKHLIELLFIYTILFNKMKVIRSWWRDIMNLVVVVVVLTFYVCFYKWCTRLIELLLVCFLSFIKQDEVGWWWDIMDLVIFMVIGVVCLLVFVLDVWLYDINMYVY